MLSHRYIWVCRLRSFFRLYYDRGIPSRNYKFLTSTILCSHLDVKYKIPAFPKKAGRPWKAAIFSDRQGQSQKPVYSLLEKEAACSPGFFGELQRLEEGLPPFLRRLKPELSGRHHCSK